MAPLSVTMTISSGSEYTLLPSIPSHGHYHNGNDQLQYNGVDRLQLASDPIFDLRAVVCKVGTAAASGHFIAAIFILYILMYIKLINAS
jgi:hypothetical protein